MFQAEVRAKKFGKTESNLLGCMVRNWKNKLLEEKPAKASAKCCSDCQEENQE